MATVLRPGQKVGRHLFEDGTTYCSSEPCPLCLAARYWARIPVLVFGASSHDVAANGFEDLQFYRQMATPIGERFLREDQADGDLHAEAVAVLSGLADLLPEPVVPKF